MKQMTYAIQPNQLELPINAFGYELLREVVIPDILGEDSRFIMYWAGKRLARKYPLPTIDDVISFFEKAGWGTLTIKNQKKNEIIFELDSELVKKRFELHQSPSFQLEAGFIAEQLELMNQFSTEAYEEIKRRSQKVIFTVKWDVKDHNIEK